MFGTAAGNQTNVPHSGWLKCKLVHGRGYSVIVPDQIYLGPAASSWIQPFTFMPCQLFMDDSGIACVLRADIAAGATVRVDFAKKDFVRRLPDGSELYRCVVHGPTDLASYATGVAFLAADQAPYLRLFHHTTVPARDAILASRTVRGSAWNIQGNKKLTNVAYAYFTPLDRIVFDDDLRCIAMAADGRIHLKIDGFDQPAVVLPGWEEALKDSVLTLDVYRSSTLDRNQPIAFDVEASAIAPAHVLRHEPPGEPVFYEITHPFIARVGVVPYGAVPFSKDMRIDGASATKRFDYMIVGDARAVDGLAAPYDEENTEHLLKIERTSGDQTMLDFWFATANTDQYSGKTVELQQFAIAGPPKTT
jgi:hypothetical protein